MNNAKITVTGLATVLFLGHDVPSHAELAAFDDSNGACDTVVCDWIPEYTPNDDAGRPEGFDYSDEAEICVNKAKACGVLRPLIEELEKGNSNSSDPNNYRHYILPGASLQNRNVPCKRGGKDGNSTLFGYGDFGCGEDGQGNSSLILWDPAKKEPLECHGKCAEGAVELGGCPALIHELGHALRRQRGSYNGKKIPACKNKGTKNDELFAVSFENAYRYCNQLPYRCCHSCCFLNIPGCNCDGERCSQRRARGSNSECVVDPVFDELCSFCGDGELQPNAGESCDDGSQCDDGTDCTSNPLICTLNGVGVCAPRDGDGCSASCVGICGGAGHSGPPPTENPAGEFDACSWGADYTQPEVDLPQAIYHVERLDVLNGTVAGGTATVVDECFGDIVHFGMARDTGANGSQVSILVRADQYSFMIEAESSHQTFDEMDSNASGQAQFRVTTYFRHQEPDGLPTSEVGTEFLQLRGEGRSKAEDAGGCGCTGGIQFPISRVGNSSHGTFEYSPWGVSGPTYRSATEYWAEARGGALGGSRAPQESFALHRYSVSLHLNNENGGMCVAP